MADGVVEGAVVVVNPDRGGASLVIPMMEDHPSFHAIGFEGGVAFLRGMDGSRWSLDGVESEDFDRITSVPVVILSLVDLEDADSDPRDIPLKVEAAHRRMTP